MSKIFETLITDRPNKETYYNYTDLNRVEKAVSELAELLTANGYYTTVEPLEIEDVIEDEPHSPLPIGYSEVEYLESSGTQYIDTGINVSSGNYNKLCFIIDTNIIDTGSSWRVNGSTGAGCEVFYGLAPANTIRFALGTGSMDTGITYTFERMVFNYDLKNSKVSAGELVPETAITLNTPTTSANFFLFASSSSGIASTFHSERIYSCQIWEDSVLIRNFIPCLNTEGVPCLYDTVTEQDYLNLGTGSFIVPEGPYSPVAKTEITIIRNEWKMSDVPTARQMQRYLDNVKICVRQFNAATGITLPVSMDDLDYIGANNIEKTLVKTNELLSYMIEVLRYSGTFYSGNMNGLRGYCL